MGDMADYYRDLQIDDEIGSDYFNGEHWSHIWREYQKKKLYWSTKDDNNILIQDMSESHIHNILKRLEAHPKRAINEAIPEWIDVLEHELSIRPPQALPDFN